MKRLLLIITLCLILTGCRDFTFVGRELDTVDFAMVMGIDINPANGNVIVTLSMRRAKKSIGESGEFESISTSAESASFFEALKVISTWNDKGIIFGHLEFVLVGEQAAREGILPLLDHYVRSYETRLTSNMLIVKDGMAKDVITTTSAQGNFLSDRLLNHLEDSKEQNYSGGIKVYELMNLIEDKLSSAYVPYIITDKFMDPPPDDGGGGGSGGGEGRGGEKGNGTSGLGSKDIRLTGFGVFKGDKLITFLDERDSRVLKLLKDSINGSVITLIDEKVGIVSIEIVENNVKIKPKIENQKLYCDIDISLSGNIGEIRGSQSVFDKKTINRLNSLFRNSIQAEVEHLLDVAKENKIDFLGIGNKFYMKYPVKFKPFIDNWGTNFANIEFKINVNSHVRRSYVLDEPLKAGEDV